MLNKPDMKNKYAYNFLLVASILAVFSSCRVFNTNRMFKTKHEILVDSIQRLISDAEKNYVVKKNDFLAIKVYSNNAERLIDPDFELSKQQIFQGNTEPPKYLVRADGYARFPMVGDVYVNGLTLYQVDTLLGRKYSNYYHNAFVITKYVNRRVIVLGPTGGKVIPLENENTNLIEIIAHYGGINEYGKAFNIRVIRGDLKNPNVEIIDLSTIEGMKQANLNVHPNDIIYIETSRRFFSESLKEISPLIGLITNILITIVLLTR
jgi:polysaccharide export outer membrane protein